MKLYYHICSECGNTMDEGHRPVCMTSSFTQAVRQIEDSETREIEYITEREFLDGIVNDGVNMDPKDNE